MKRGFNEKEDKFRSAFSNAWNSDSYSGSESYDSDGERQADLPSYDSSEEEGPDPTLIQQAARILPDDLADIDDIIYIAGGNPVYTSSTRPTGGGRLSVATLGPGGVIPGTSKPDRSVIPAIVTAEAAYGALKAGHLLNHEFGGAGDDADNLTILSTSANSAMRSFDNAIKAAVAGHLTVAYQCANRMGVDVQTLGYGIQVTITTAPGFWSNVAGHAGYPVANGVNCQAAIVGQPTQAGVEALLTARWGADRVHNHANLMQQLLAAVAALQGQVAAANNAGQVPNP